MKDKKYIEPCYIYDADNNPVEVYLSISDYEAFMKRLKMFSEKIEKHHSQGKKAAPKKLDKAKAAAKKKL